MIYVWRDSSLIPKKFLQVAERAQRKLEALPADERPAFIKKKSHVWRAFARYLLKMSYGKCWYSESLDPQSFFDGDHYRPKLQTRRSEPRHRASRCTQPWTRAEVSLAHEMHLRCMHAT